MTGRRGDNVIGGTTHRYTVGVRVGVRRAGKSHLLSPTKTFTVHDHPQEEVAAVVERALREAYEPKSAS